MSIVDNHLISIPGANINILGIMSEFRVDRAFPWLKGLHYLKGVPVKDDNVILVCPPKSSPVLMLEWN